MCNLPFLISSLSAPLYLSCMLLISPEGLIVKSYFKLNSLEYIFKSIPLYKSV